MDTFAHDSPWLARCQQLFDTSLPNGGYAHSQGLEGLIQMGEIHDEATFTTFLRDEFTDALTYTDLPLFLAAHNAVTEEKYDELSPLDEMAWATKSSHEFREAGRTVGRQTMLLFTRIFQPPSIEGQRLARCSEFFGYHQSTVVLGSLAACLDLPVHASSSAYAHQLLASIITSTVKLLQFGPAQVQRLIFELGSEVPVWVRKASLLSIEEIGTIAPRWEIASARHEHAERRLFIS